ncbi:MAG: transporter substrate-binding domain-containing protein, partial [Synechococcaceae cyanobacterium]|nr:transporter substrate-binding domain-containing protein [Synechococcaceae cyanobacterium]
ENDDTEELLYRVSHGDIDVTIADNLIAEVAQSYLSDLRIDITISGDRPVAWAMRPGSEMLRDSVDAFVTQVTPSVRLPERVLGDLPAIRERGVLRVLTRNNATSYFVWRGEVLGFEHDLATDFARSLDLRVEFVVVPTWGALSTWLLDGRGDIAAAGITRGDTADRLMAYSRPYHRVVEMAVTDTADTTLHLPEDLAGRRVAARRSSSYWQTALRLLEQGVALELEPVPEDMETEEVLGLVATGDYDVAFADSHTLEVELMWRDDIRGAFAVSDSVEHAWMARPGDAELMAAVNAYFDRSVRGTFYNLTKAKYFGNRKASRRYVAGRADRTGA